MLRVIQYFYKRRTSGSAKDLVMQSGFGKELADAIQERFEQKNGASVKRFYAELEGSIEHLPRLMRQSFKKYIEEEKKKFERDMRLNNLQSVSEIVD